MQIKIKTTLNIFNGGETVDINGSIQTGLITKDGSMACVLTTSGSGNIDINYLYGSDDFEEVIENPMPPEEVYQAAPAHMTLPQLLGQELKSITFKD